MKKSIKNSYRILLKQGKEFEQAMIRLLACLICTAYSLFAYYNGLLDIAIVNIFIATIPCCILFGLWAFLYNDFNPLRLDLAILTGVGTTTYALSLSNEIGTPFIVIYFWIILGNGLRFGSTYLLINTIFTIIGFLIVINVSPFWSAHLYISYSILFAMFILPAYINILQKRLESAVNEAKEANKAKSLFLANMSHEIRTPLNGVIGMSDMLEITKLDKEQIDYVKTIQASARALLSIIDDILDISKIESGKTEIKNNKFSLYSLLSSTIDTMQPLAEKKGLNCRLHVSPDVSNYVLGDDRLLQQVLINLIGNSIKFTQVGDIDLNVSCINSTFDQTRIRFEIKDTGIGIAEDAQLTIFEKFTQADESISSKYGGTGLGASIAKNLIEMMGGKIAVDSQLGAGSNFWFELDLNRFNDSEEYDFSHLRTLLVATYGENHSTLARYFDEMEVHWEHAITAPEAVSLIKDTDLQESYDLIILDKNGVGESIWKFTNSIVDINGPKQAKLILLHGDSKISEDISNSWFYSSINSPLIKESIHNILIAASLDAKQPQITELTNIKSNVKLNFIVGEDNITNQKVIKRYIESAGHTVDIFENGELVLDAIEKNKYDIMILDMHMPVMDGPETIKLYKFMTSSSKRIPIIVLTANATKEAEKESKKLGVDAYLTKPVKRDKLFDTVFSLVDLEKIEKKAFDSRKPKLKLVYPQPLQDKEVIDITTLDNLALLGDSKEFMHDLIKGFLKDSMKLINSIVISHNNNNYHEVADYAHALKGSAQSIGATELGDVASKIYKQSLGVNYDAISNQSNTLMNVHDETSKAMITYLDNLEISALK